jgi:predicted glycosyltransferase
MGGYNTLVEAAAHGVPTVCVPRTVPRTEQLIRANAFAALGLLQVCRPDQLNPAALQEMIAAALKASGQELLRRARVALNFDGATRAAECLLALGRLEAEQPRPEETVAPGQGIQ